jgi:LemA protein
LRRAVIPVLLLVAVGIAAGSEFVGVRRNLIAQREAIDAQWAQVSDAFDERAALVANLADMIRHTADPNNRAFADAAHAQAALSPLRVDRLALSQAKSPQQKIEANARLMNAFARLYLEADEHPKLTESARYRRLNEEIGNAESRVAVERRKYNDLLEHYNAQLQRFPANIVAGLSGMSRIDAYVRTEQEPK